MTETDGNRRKRLAMRAWRRGTKEMDLILGPFADVHLAGMETPALAAFEALLAENDQDLMAWVIGGTPPPPVHADLLTRIAAHARATSRPRG